MDSWQTVDISKKLFENVPEVDLRAGAAAMENVFINDTGAHSRFPGLKRFAKLPAGRVYLGKFQDDLIAVTSAGTVSRLDQRGGFTDATGVPPGGGNRPIFVETDDQLVIASGGPLVQLHGAKTEILSKDAPEATHAGYLDGFLIAPEQGTELFNFSTPGAFTKWDPLDVLSAESRPDIITAMIVTENRQAIFCGPDSIEQWEPYPGGDRPFFRRWAVSEGLFAPYTLVSSDGGTWGVTRFREFSRIRGPQKQPVSTDINYSLSKIDDWTDAWAAHLPTFGQRFIVLQAPFATNHYGTKGVTVAFDYREKHWFYLYGWDDAEALPTRWPGWSILTIWGRNFVGGDDGIVYEVTDGDYSIDGGLQRLLFRTAPLDKMGTIQVDGVRLRLKRGAGSNDGEGQIAFRSKRDGKRWSMTQFRGLGKAGDEYFFVHWGQQGSGTTWQFEWWVTDDVPVEIAKFEIDAMKVSP